MTDDVKRARRQYAARAWADAYDALSRANTAGTLEADDVERLAICAGLTGHEEGSVEAFARLHQLRLDAGDTARATRAAFWAAMRLFSLGEAARGSGWLARAQRLVEDAPPESLERGYLSLPQVFRCTAAGDLAGARAAAANAASIGTRHKDRDLQALGRMFEGRAAIRQGRLDEGLVLLDEAMVDVERLSDLVGGLVYCGAIAACQQSYALDRAREWTTALTRWCEAQPQLVPFAGACLINRAQILQLAGEWPAALVEARRATERLSGTKDAERGNARYEEGELHRLRGEYMEAERAYAQASELGRDPQPGMSLLHLARGRVDVAAAAMRRVVAASSNPLQRTRFLPAYVEVMLAASDRAEARRAADELRSLAQTFAMEMLHAMAQHAHGAVLVAEGDARSAVDPLRDAQAIWQRIGAPYLSARIRVVVARAFTSLGDDDGAQRELDAAKKVFDELGAVVDVGAAARAAAEQATHGLSPRELEVLRLVATGKTNKMIAKELFVSEKTIDRHVSNLFAKLNVPTRAAATAWAHRHGVVR